MCDTRKSKPLSRLGAGVRLGRVTALRERLPVAIVVRGALAGRIPEISLTLLGRHVLAAFTAAQRTRREAQESYCSNCAQPLSHRHLTLPGRPVFRGPAV